MCKRLSNSGLNTFLTCPKKYEWAIMQGWQPITDSPALKFGKEFHKALETGNLNTELFSTDEAEKMRQLFDIYQKHLAKTHTIFFQKEVPLSMPMPYRPAYEIVGKADGLVEIDDGNTYLYELKTTSDDPYNRSLRLKHENQVYLYALMAKRPLAGIVVDIVSTKDLPKEPRLLKSGKLSRDVSQNTTQELFDKFCIDSGYLPTEEEVEFYRMNFPKTYSPIYREVLEIPEFNKANTDQIIHPFRLLCDAINGNFWKNTTSCLTFKSKCPYYDLCFENNQREIDYMLQTSFKRYDYYAINKKENDND